jgi:hypothetical protein
MRYGTVGKRGSCAIILTNCFLSDGAFQALRPNLNFFAPPCYATEGNSSPEYIQKKTRLANAPYSRCMRPLLPQARTSAAPHPQCALAAQLPMLKGPPGDRSLCSAVDHSQPYMASSARDTAVKHREWGAQRGRAGVSGRGSVPRHMNCMASSRLAPAVAAGAEPLPPPAPPLPPPTAMLIGSASAASTWPDCTYSSICVAGSRWVPLLVAMIGELGMSKGVNTSCDMSSQRDHCACSWQKCQSTKATSTTSRFLSQFSTICRSELHAAAIP